MIYILLALSCLFSSLCAVEHCDFIVHAIPKCGTHFIKRTLKIMTDEEEIILHNPTKEDLEWNRHSNSYPRFYNVYIPSVEQRIHDSGYKILTMIRDPRDALLSLVVYMQKFAGRGTKRDFFVVDERFDEMSFDEQLLSLMTAKDPQKNYLTYYRDRIGWSRSKENYCVKYENLVGSEGGGDERRQLKEIQNIARFLDLSLTKERAQEIAASIYLASNRKENGSIIPSAVETVDGKEFHRAHCGEWKKFFKPKHKKLLKQEWGQLLIDLGYEKDLKW